MDWQPIKNAPTDVRVECGKWEVWKDEKEWKTSTGIVYESWFFGLLKGKTYYFKEYSAWRHLPSPPKQIA